MRIDWWTLGLQTVNVLVLLWILSRFLFRPVAAIVAARQAEAARLLDAAKAAKAAAETQRDAAAAEVARLAAGRGEALRLGQQEAEAHKAALLAAARAEAERVRAAAATEIADARTRETAAAGTRASVLAVEIAAKLLERLPDGARVTGFIDGLAAGLAKVPEASRTGLGRPDAPMRLKAARALTPEETASCQASLARALGHEVTFTVEVDPGLIAGLEIEAPHAVVRNSFRADLARITAELTRDAEAPQAAPGAAASP